MNLEALKDLMEFGHGYAVDTDGTALQIKESDTDYVIVRRERGRFLVEAYDTPATIMRDICDICVEAKEDVQFVSKRPSTKARKYGR